ncbi:MAG: GNAT family N-acetyltransferase [Chitinophagaceae bacterium]
MPAALNFQPFPELQTNRLVLRRLTVDDRAAIFFLRSDETVLRYVHKEPAVSVQEAVDFIHRIHTNADTGEGILWGIVQQDNPAVVTGTICLWNMQPENYRAEVGFALHPDHWRKGIMKEALLAVIGYAFATLQLHSLEARIDPDNLASAALLESAGFVREGYFREDFCFRGRFMDTAVYSLLHR